MAAAPERGGAAARGRAGQPRAREVLSALAVLLCASLALAACKGKDTDKDKVAAAGDLGTPEFKTEAKAAPNGDGGDDHEAAATGHRDGGPQEGAEGADDIEATYTPRKLPIDEEECDDAARDVLSRLREKAQRLSERARALSQREQELRERERAQGEAKKKIEEQVAELRKLSAELQAGPERAQREREKAEAEQAAQRAAAARAEQRERVQRVTRMVGGMPPQRAASMLGAMADDALAAEVLESLPQEAAGKVLAQMRPESAARLAGRIGGGKEKDQAKDQPAPDKDKDKVATKEGGQR